MFARSYRQSDLQLPKFTVEIGQLIVLDYFKNKKDKKLHPIAPIMSSGKMFILLQLSWSHSSGSAACG